VAAVDTRLLSFSVPPNTLHSTLHNTNTIDGVIHLIGLLWFGVCVVIWYCCVIFPVFWCKYYLVQHVTIQKMIKKYFIKNVLIKYFFYYQNHTNCILLNSRSTMRHN
jgi:hypothetical protein